MKLLNHVISIRERLQAGESASALAREFRVSPVAIHKIKHRQTYKWLDTFRSESL